MEHAANSASPRPFEPSTHLILLGLRGSGKSTLGRRVARELKLPLLDLDELTTRILASRSVHEAFASHGERIFRHAERVALRQILAEPAHTIALGGGTPTAPGAGDLLRAAVARGSVVVYLRASAPCLRARLEAEDSTQRPSLTDAGVLDEIPELLAQRDPLYLDLASDVLEIDGLDEDACARRIVDIARSRPLRPRSRG